MAIFRSFWIRHSTGLSLVLLYPPSKFKVWKALEMIGGDIFRPFRCQMAKTLGNMNLELENQVSVTASHPLLGRQTTEERRKNDGISALIVVTWCRSLNGLQQTVTCSTRLLTSSMWKRGRRRYISWLGWRGVDYRTISINSAVTRNSRSKTAEM